VGSSDAVTIELYGIPRVRAGLAQLVVPAGTLREALRAAEHACPGLGRLVRNDGRLDPQFLLSIDGRRFVMSLEEAVLPGERLLLLSADAGG
jgi:hypothetical protein